MRERARISAPACRKFTCNVPLKRYYDVDRQKFIRDSLPSIMGYSLGQVSINDWRDEYVPGNFYGKGYSEDRHDSWRFVPKDDDWED